jgi:hypothetical protein
MYRRELSKLAKSTRPWEVFEIPTLAVEKLNL